MTTRILNWVSGNCYGCVHSNRRISYLTMFFYAMEHRPMTVTIFLSMQLKAAQDQLPRKKLSSDWLGNYPQLLHEARPTEHVLVAQKIVSYYATRVVLVFPHMTTTTQLTT